MESAYNVLGLGIMEDDSFYDLKKEREILNEILLTCWNCVLGVGDFWFKSFFYKDICLN